MVTQTKHSTLGFFFKLAKKRARCFWLSSGFDLGIRRCIVLPSKSKSFKSPSSHVLKRLSRQVLCSLVFDLEEGFCSNKIGRTMAAFIPELEVKTLYSLASSKTKDFPALPKGTLKRFGPRLQCSYNFAISNIEGVSKGYRITGTPGEERFHSWQKDRELQRKFRGSTKWRLNHTSNR